MTIPDIPKGAEGSQVVRDVVVAMLRRKLEQAHRENQRLRQQIEDMRDGRREAA